MAHVSANASSWTLHSNQPLRRFALLLHGSLDRRKKYVATCAASQLAMIVHANDADGGVDVYIHSWDAQRYPGTLPTIHGVNAAYGSALRASLHEPSVADLPHSARSIGRRCSDCRLLHQRSSMGEIGLPGQPPPGTKALDTLASRPRGRSYATRRGR